jgi:hypothetical protein
MLSSSVNITGVPNNVMARARTRAQQQQHHPNLDTHEPAHEGWPV